MKLEKNTSEISALKHRYIGVRASLVEAAISISELKIRIRRNADLHSAQFADLESEILRLEFSKKQLEMAILIKADTPQLTTEDALDQAGHQLDEENKELEARQKRIQELKDLADSGAAGGISIDEWRGLKNQCGSLFRKISFILHDDRQSVNSQLVMTDSEKKHWWDLAEEAKRQFDVDMLTTILTHLNENFSPAEVDQDAEHMKEKLRVLTEQLSSAQRVISHLLSDPLLKYTDDAAWIAQRRNEMNHQIRLLQVDNVSLERRLGIRGG